MIKKVIHLFLVYFTYCISHFADFTAMDIGHYKQHQLRAKTKKLTNQQTFKIYIFFFFLNDKTKLKNKKIKAK